MRDFNSQLCSKTGFIVIARAKYLVANIADILLATILCNMPRLVALVTPANTTIQTPLVLAMRVKHHHYPRNTKECWKTGPVLLLTTFSGEVSIPGWNEYFHEPQLYHTLFHISRILKKPTCCTWDTCLFHIPCCQPHHLLHHLPLPSELLGVAILCSWGTPSQSGQSWETIDQSSGLRMSDSDDFVGKCCITCCSGSTRWCHRPRPFHHLPLSLGRYLWAHHLTKRSKWILKSSFSLVWSPGRLKFLSKCNFTSVVPPQASELGTLACKVTHPVQRDSLNLHY